jgi:hypothetical protein
VNDTTSTPDEPDGKGRVATGEQAAIPPQASRAEPAAPAENGNAAGTNGSAQAEAVTLADRPVAPAGVDAPTAHIQLPQRPSPTPAPAQAPPGTGAAETATTQAQAPPAAPPATAPPVAPSPTPRPPDPEPAPGPMPGPGPDAAAPPPWNRMSDGGGAAAEAPADTTHASPQGGGFLDEGPTAFLEPPSYPDESRPGSKSNADSWSSVRAVRSRPPRQAALQLKRIDPWSALKLGLVLAVVLFFIWLVAVGVLYGALDGMGVWDRLNGTYADLVSGDTPTGSPLISAGRVFGFAAVIGAINSLLFAVAVTVGAFVYNVSADLVGGIELTLSERD